MGIAFAGAVALILLSKFIMPLFMKRPADYYYVNEPDDASFFDDPVIAAEKKAESEDKAKLEAEEEALRKAEEERLAKKEAARAARLAEAKAANEAMLAAKEAKKAKAAAKKAEEEAKKKAEAEKKAAEEKKKADAEKKAEEEKKKARAEAYKRDAEQASFTLETKSGKKSRAKAEKTAKLRKPNMRMKKDELVELAHEYGIGLPEKVTKAQIIELIEQKRQ